MIAAAHRAAVAALLAVAAGAAHGGSWLYRVRIDTAAPRSAQVSVDLPATDRARDFSVQARGTAMNVMPQIADVRCDDVPVAPDEAGAWRVQGWRCVRLHWRIDFDELTEQGVNAAAQANLYDPRRGFWLLSDPASLLRPVGELAHEGEIEVEGSPVHSGDPSGRTQRRRLPSMMQAPEFYVIGNVPTSIVRQGNADLIYFNALGVPLAELFRQHRRQLGYLMRASGARFPTLLRSSVLWLPIAAARRQYGGAAGHRTLLVNGAIEQGRLVQPELALLFLLHEQFHQLAQHQLPLWINESLAQYYAIKALRRTDLPPAVVAAAERRFIDATRTPKLKLRAAARRVQHDGDEDAYGSFYTDGATFWDRLDRAIQRKSGFRSLDSELPRLLAANYTDDGLPDEVLKRLRRYAGDRAVDELLVQYVGD